MRVHLAPAQAAGERGCVAAAGTFDGVHLGHQEVLRRAAALARERGVVPLMLTFSVPPARALAGGPATAPLMILADRLLLAQGCGMQAALVLPFSREQAEESAESFVRRVPGGALAASALVVGQGWRFGRGREGDAALLSRLGRELSFAVEEVPPVLAGGTPVSSTRIREALLAGDVAEAARLLGRSHFMRGTVEKGSGRGRSLGFPTVNIRAEELTPASGVYAGACSPADRSFLAPAAIFIGTCPTFGGGPPAVEAHLPGLARDLYGSELVLGFLARLREERTFPDPAALARQISLDVERAVAIFSAARPGVMP
jgi:riboflavin kinase/FMN adenylyltransferase